MAALTCRRGLLSLFSWLFLLATTVSSLPKPAQEKDMAPNLLQNANPSTELKPQTLSEEDLPPGYLLIVNLYAVKNASGETVDDMLEDEVFENVTEHRGHVASILVLFDEDKEDENAVDLKGFAQEIANDGAHVQAYEKDGKVRMLIVDLELMDLESALNWTTNNNPERMSKVRTRRSACLKCSGGGGGKGGGGVSAIPVYVVPVGITGGQGGGMRGGGHHGGGGGRYGGGHYGGGGYPGGGGCNSCQQGYGGSGGGYGGSYSQSQSSASSSSYGWGGKK